MVQPENASSEGTIDSFMVKQLLSKTNDIKQYQLQVPSKNFRNQNTIRQSYPYFTEQNNQHRTTISLSTSEENLRTFPHVEPIWLNRIKARYLQSITCHILSQERILIFHL